MSNTALSSKTFFQGRVSMEVKRRWQMAADIRGQTLTDFLIVAANDATEKIFEAEERIVLSAQEQEKLAEMLSRPPRLNERLRKAIREELIEIRKP
jgi:uncharacterized protein (DUF1778 family)